VNRPIRIAATCALLAAACSCRAPGPTGPSVDARMAARDFPSVFQAWNRAENVGPEDKWTNVARHDLIWHAPGFFGLRWDKHPAGLAEGFTPKSIRNGLAIRKKLLGLNPNLIVIAEIRYRDAGKRFLPAGHPWWRRDKAGQIVKGWAEGRFLQLDFSSPAFRRHVAARASAAVRSGVFDGVLLDWWSEDWDRLQLVKAIRRAIGPRALILVNTNQRIEDVTAPYVNGWFMECTQSRTAKDWRRIERAARWAQTHLRRPRVVCVETWSHTSRKDLHLMRATTALALTHCDGYCLFGDPNPLPTPDHLHDWYPFWDARLGRPLGQGARNKDGTVRREFDYGTVVYNPMGNGPVTVTFPEPRTSAASGKTTTAHLVNCPDGDLFLRSSPR